ncbi:acylphosphatase [Sphingosinicella microcystinivorans]|uniref:acylphosphatase n=1 Tax=Sphingosinicella microcystinivorans TaxID=335406 RepID=UPI0022F3B66C|nr:acylphosphatase [Sphingosinicella microcystinivorans]WBX83719.1 acylphosphatase [Sphingosinicella microcystinivorans]
MTEERVARRLRIHGRVQGVWYRAWTLETAQRLGLDGWVRNRIDGTVEVFAVGPADAVEKLVAACREGPPAAKVERLDVEAAEGIVRRGFTKKPTV